MRKTQVNGAYIHKHRHIFMSLHGQLYEFIPSHASQSYTCHTKNNFCSFRANVGLGRQLNLLHAVTQELYSMLRSNIVQ